MSVLTNVTRRETADVRTGGRMSGRTSDGKRGRTSGRTARLLLAALVACATLQGAGLVSVQAQQPQAGRRVLLSSPARPRPAQRRGLRGAAARAFASLRTARSRIRQTVTASVLASVTNEAAAEGVSDDRRITEDPQWRLNWFLFQRSYPFETLPSRGRFFAFARAEGLLPTATPPPPTTERWRPIGPTPIAPKFPSMGSTGGRLASIAVSPADPRIVLVGCATGGIWRSTDGGDNFVPVSDDQVDLAVGSLAFARSDPSIVYAGMGDVAGGYMGTGVLKSTDGGATWARVSGDTLPAPGTIGNVVVDPANAQRVYITQFSFRAATGEGEVFASGFFLSEDGGRTWRKTLSGLPRGLVHHPSRPLTLYLSMATTFAASPPSAGLYKSEDGGRTWRAVFTPPYLGATDIKIAVTPHEPETVYLFTGGEPDGRPHEVTLHASRDGGATWANLNNSVDVGQFGYNSHVAADPADARTLYLGTRDLYKSTDRGLTWVNLTRNWSRVGNAFEFDPSGATSHTDQHALAFSTTDSRVIYVGNDGGLWRSRDGGATLQSLNATLSNALLNSVTLHPTDGGRSCAGSQDNGALARAPSLTRWAEFISGDSGRCLMHPTEPSVLYSNYIFGTIYRFRNDGNTFDATIATDATFSEPPGAARIAFYPPFVVDSSGQLYFGTWRLFVSTNRGNLWDDPSDGRDLTRGFTGFGADVLSAIGVGPAGSRVIYTGSAQGRLMVSRDGGVTWRDATRDLPRRFITSLTVDPANADRAYVTLSGFGSPHVFRTTDGGGTWQDISSGLPNIPVNAFHIDPVRRETFYAGTDIGVFRSLDEGRNWDRFNQGIPPAIVTGFASQPSGVVQLSTYGRGAYELVR